MARATVGQSLLAFDRQVDIVLRWDVGLHGNRCLQGQVVRDLRELGLL